MRDSPVDFAEEAFSFLGFGEGVASSGSFLFFSFTEAGLACLLSGTGADVTLATAVYSYSSDSGYHVACWTYV